MSAFFLSLSPSTSIDEDNCSFCPQIIQSEMSEEMDMDSKLKQWLLQTDLLFLSTLITGVVILGWGGGGG